MSSNANRFCTNCGSPNDPNSRFCANCGSPIDIASANPNAAEVQPGSSAPDLATIPSHQETEPSHISGSSTPIPPPPPNTFQSSTVSDYQAPQVSYPVVPDFARPQKGATRRTGLRLLLVILVVLVVLGAVGGTIYYLRGKNAANTGPGTSNSANTAATSTATSITPTPTTTLSAGTVSFSPALSYFYADVKVSILDVKQANSFSDDSSYYANPGVLRLDIKEESQPIDGGYYNYGYDSLRLIMSDGTTLQVSSKQTGAGIDTNVSRSNWLDFATGRTVDVSKLVLRVGSDTEAQMNIPLQNNADLSKYQPKSYTINKQASYSYDNGDPNAAWTVNWTITNVTVSYSALGFQAKKGMIYVIISSRLDNTSKNNAYVSLGDQMRLKSGDTSSPPDKNTLAGSVSAGQTNVTGNTTFEMPQGSTSFTCTVLASGSGTTDTSIQFQLQ